MNRYYYLHMVLVCFISLAGLTHGEQSLNRSENSSEYFSSGGDSSPPEIQTFLPGANGTGSQHQDRDGLPEGDAMPLKPLKPEFLNTGSPFSPGQADDYPGTGAGNYQAGWMTYLADPRYSIQIPPNWSVFQTTTTSDNGTVIMFQDNSASPSFVSVMAADNQYYHFFTREEAGELEMNHVYPSFERWGLSLIPDAGEYALSGQASISRSVMAGDPHQQVVSSYILSDSSGYYWISLIGSGYSTYMRNTGIFNRILSSFVPSSDDARRLWNGELNG